MASQKRRTGRRIPKPVRQRRSIKGLASGEAAEPPRGHGPSDRFLRSPCHNVTSTGTSVSARVKKSSDGAFYNSACLLAPEGELSRHDKLELVWLTERLPPLLSFSWFREHFLPLFHVSAPAPARNLAINCSLSREKTVVPPTVGGIDLL